MIRAPISLPRLTPIRGAALFALITQFFVGCTVGPDASRPALPTPPPGSFINATPTTSTPVMSAWWQQIDDPLFDQFVTSLLSDNLSLQESRERVVQARQRLAIQSGQSDGRLPTLSAEAGATRGFTPTPAAPTNPDRLYADHFTADLNVSWTFDLFGRLSRSIESSEASYLSVQAEREALTHPLIAELLNRRVSIAINARLLELARQNVANREALSQQVRRRYDLGTSGTALADAYLASDNVTTVQSDVAEFERLLTADLYRLDLLLGQPPGTTQLEPSAFPLLAPPASPPTSLPADLLDRRPDLRASELRARAATANVGVAIADRYPQVTLGGRLGVADPSISNLFSSDQLAGSLLANISQRLFAGGTLRANLRLQESAARELATRYAADVLDALREVESTLQADQSLATQLAAQDSSLAALRAAETLSESRYRNGIQNLTTFLDTQQRRYRTEQTWLLTPQLRWNTRISLYLALGGDWTN
ncbi:MAG: efflux transporter outer membrane subunit [Candidatus Synoicihabitans palmerolidicus]|nr:efflux transporter outer membrane subunit [Candidatus Synoicihabitans palmerolidicus]